LAAALHSRRRTTSNLAERWATAIGLAQLSGFPAPDVLADVRAGAESTDCVPAFPFLDGDVEAVAGYTLDLLADKHRLPPGPWAN
jgi:hypothetical protein